MKLGTCILTQNKVPERNSNFGTWNMS